jgi:hypothetical protein
MNLKRNICSCNRCKWNCKTLPGYLIPTDILIICKKLGYEEKVLYFAETFLLASAGAIVQKGEEIFRIPTLVPRRNEKGYCIFFTEEEKCLIHSVSPFGCRYFDCKQTKEEADAISKIGLNSIIELSTESQIYKILIHILAKKGLISKPPEVLKKERGEYNERTTN